MDIDGVEQPVGIVATGGSLPFDFAVTTSKLLDVVIAISPKSRKMSHENKKNLRAKLNKKFYLNTRPGFYAEISSSLHVAYVGQPEGHGTQHHWKLFCDDGLKDQLEILILGTTLTTSPQPNRGRPHDGREWGGMFFRSEAEIRIAQALDEQQVLFFTNVRGRIGLRESLLSQTQLTGRVELDFLIVQKGKCLSLEVDGSHHSEDAQIVRDYARDRVMLKEGIPTIRFSAQDCLSHPEHVVVEALAILKSC